jgi:hypothetical protein
VAIVGFVGVRFRKCRAAGLKLLCPQTYGRLSGSIDIWSVVDTRNILCSSCKQAYVSVASEFQEEINLFILA